MSVLSTWNGGNIYIFFNKSCILFISVISYKETEAFFAVLCIVQQVSVWLKQCRERLVVGR